MTHINSYAAYTIKTTLK